MIYVLCGKNFGRTKQAVVAQMHCAYATIPRHHRADRNSHFLKVSRKRLYVKSNPTHKCSNITILASRQNRLSIASFHPSIMKSKSMISPEAEITPSRFWLPTPLWCHTKTPLKTNQNKPLFVLKYRSREASALPGTALSIWVWHA